MAVHRIPMLWGMNQVTAHQPMSEAIAQLHRIEALPGVVCASIATCFPLADVPCLGASVYVVTDDDVDLAQRLADELGEWIWARRAEWHFPRFTTAMTLDQLGDHPPRPLVLADRDDNTGGGSPGDSTGVLRTFLERGLRMRAFSTSSTRRPSPNAWKRGRGRRSNLPSAPSLLLCRANLC